LFFITFHRPLRVARDSNKIFDSPGNCQDFQVGSDRQSDRAQLGQSDRLEFAHSDRAQLGQSDRVLADLAPCQSAALVSEWSHIGDTMLIEFRVENYRSIGPEQVLSAARAPDVGADDKIAGAELELLPAIALYGPNGSGKSNMISALQQMCQIVLSDLKSHQPFAWGDRWCCPTMFEVEFIVEAVKYRYGFLYTSTEIVEEWLSTWATGHEQEWFQREHMKAQVDDRSEIELDLPSHQVGPNELFLAVAERSNHRLAAIAMGWFRSIYAVQRTDDLPSPKEQDVLVSNSAFVRKALIASDLGITDVRIVNREGLGPLLEFQHGTDPRAWLTWEQESNGTRRLVTLLPSVLSALASGGVVLVDDLELSIHPSLVNELVRIFNTPNSNPKNAQIIFTTHALHLLSRIEGEPLLRRDQIWFSEKDRNGFTKIYPLTDFKPLSNENIDRAYLQGRYGASPSLFDLL